VAQQAIGPPDLVFYDGRRIAQQHAARLLLVLYHLTDDLLQVFDQVFLTLAQRRLVRDLEEVADHLGSFAVEPAEREPQLVDTLQDLGNLLRQDQSRQVDQDRGTQPRTHVRGTARQVAVLLVVRKGQQSAELLVQLIEPVIRSGQPQPGGEHLQPQVVLLVDHEAERVIRSQEQPCALDRRRVLLAGQLPGDQVPLQEHPPGERREGRNVERDSALEGRPLRRLPDLLEDLSPL